MERVNRKQYSFFIFVFISFFIIVAASIISSNIYNSIMFRDTTESQFKESHKTVVELFLNNIEQEVKFGVMPVVYRKCSDMYKNELIVGIKIISADREICKFGDLTVGEEYSSNIHYGENKTGDIAATVKMNFSLEFKNKILKRHIFSVVFGLILLFLVLIYPLYSISKSLTYPIEDLAKLLPQGDISKIDEQLKGKKTNIKEINDLYKSTQTMAKEIKRYEFENIEKAKKEYLYKKASSIVHDIRNPILRLKLKVGGLISDLALKNNINNELEFIEELTREMLSEYRSDSQEIKDSTKLVEISRIIEKNVSSLRFSFPDCEINFHNNLNQIGAYLEILPLSLSRILQNLIKNACEANGIYSKVVNVSLNKVGDFFEISVKDNGDGIPKDIMSKLTDEGFTYGKQSGTGIGLSYCKDEISRFNGELKIESKEGEFALFKVYFPVQKSPIWAFSTLYLKEGSTLVIVDDEQEIHFYWQGLIESLGLRDLKLVNISSSKGLSNFLKSRPSGNLSFIFDHDLKDSTGVELIQEFELERKSTIISNHYDDPSLISFCEKSGVRLFPKQSLTSLKIKVINSTSLPHQLDGVLIDDDKELIDGIKNYLFNKGLNIEGFLSLNEFLNSKKLCDVNTKIFIDLNVKDPEDGLFIARELYALGFKELYIFSGHSLENKPFWIKGFISKSDIEDLVKALKD